MPRHRSTTPVWSEDVSWTDDGWGWHADQPAEASTTEDGLLRIVITAEVASAGARVTLVTRDLEPPTDLRVQIITKMHALRVEIDPRQSHVRVGELLIEADLRTATVLCPVWTGDPTELGTAEVGTLNVRAAQLQLGGDDLTIARLDHFPVRGFSIEQSEFDNDEAWDDVYVLDDSRVTFGSTYRQSIALRLGDRSRVEFESDTALYLGHIGRDSEIVGNGRILDLAEWKIHLCSGNELIRISGLLPLGYHLVRELRARMLETSTDLMGTYIPVRGDRFPVGFDRTQLEREEWLRAHTELIERHCPDPGVQSESRWLSYEHRRQTRRRFSYEWLLLTLFMKPLGYGLKPGPPAKLWVGSVACLVAIFSWQHGLLFSPLGGRTAWSHGIKLWTEALLMPAGLFSLGSESTNSVLTIEGTSLRLARLLISIPFAAMILAIRARFRLQRLTDGVI